MKAELEEEQAMLDESDPVFEAQMKEAMKLSRREAEAWQTVKRRRKLAQPPLCLNDSEDSEEEQLMQVAVRASLVEAAAAAAQPTQAAPEDAPERNVCEVGRQAVNSRQSVGSQSAIRRGMRQSRARLSSLRVDPIEGNQSAISRQSGGNQERVNAL